MSDYREFLNVEGTTRYDESYDVGFNPAWNKLRLNAVGAWDPYDGVQSVEIWLTAAAALDLADALTEAAEALEQQTADVPSAHGNTANRQAT